MAAKKKTAKRKTVPKKPSGNLSTEIVVVLDRSGSMESIKNDMVGGFNTFMAEQRKLPGDCRMTLVQFDSIGTDVVYEAKALADVPELVLEPRGGTPLLDAMGKTINLTTDRLANGQGAQRPDRVLFLVITDGHENESRRFTKEQIKKLVLERTADGWAFSFLGANVDAFADAGSMGIAAASSANFMADKQGVRLAFAAVSRSVGMYRGGSAYTVSNADPRVAQHQKSAAQTLGSMGGTIGGMARAAALTPEERSKIAKKGAEARWKKAPDVP